MSSTPWAKAASLVSRSPRRVKARTGSLTLVCRGALHSVENGAIFEVRIDDGEMGRRSKPCHGVCRTGGNPGLELGVTKGQPDDLGQHGLVDHDEHKGRSVGSAKFALHSLSSKTVVGRIGF